MSCLSCMCRGDGMPDVELKLLALSCEGTDSIAIEAV